MENKQTILEMIINTQIPRKMFFATIDAGRNKQSNKKKKKTGNLVIPINFQCVRLATKTILQSGGT